MENLSAVKSFIYCIIPILLLSFFNDTHAQTDSITYGFTVTHVDDEKHLDEIVASLAEFVHAGIYPTSRIVFDVNDFDPFTPTPENYEDIVSSIHSTSHVMGQIVDSEYWSHGNWEKCIQGYEFDMKTYIDRLTAFQNNDVLSTNVDIWEIGNEVNAPWVNDGDVFETRSIILEANDVSKQSNLTTALTLLYYPTVECVDDCEKQPNAYKNEEYMMLNWAANLVAEYSGRLDIDYVFVSYYADANSWCDTNVVDWDSIFQALHDIFPDSKLGFGECGYSSEIPPSQQEILDLIDEFYNSDEPLTSLPYFIPGNFWWTYVDDCVPFENNVYWNRMKLAIEGDISRPINPFLSSDKIISSNYPNPFNPSTVIKYYLPQNSNVKIAVYDNLGREVQVLFNGYNSEGNHEAIFNGSNVSSGVYYYIISVNGVSETKKMLLVK